MQANRKRIRDFPTGLLILILGVLVIAWNGYRILYDDFGAAKIDVPAGIQNLVLTLPAHNDPQIQVAPAQSLAIMDMRSFRIPSGNCPRRVVVLMRQSWFPVLSWLHWRSVSQHGLSLRVFWSWFMSMKKSTHRQAWTRMATDAMTYFDDLDRSIRRTCPGVQFKIANLIRQHAKVCLFDWNVYEAFLARTILTKMMIHRKELRQIKISSPIFRSKRLSGELFNLSISQSPDRCGWADRDELAHAFISFGRGSP